MKKKKKNINVLFRVLCPTYRSGQSLEVSCNVVFRFWVVSLSLCKTSDYLTLTDPSFTSSNYNFFGWWKQSLRVIVLCSAMLYVKKLWVTIQLLPIKKDQNHFLYSSVSVICCARQCCTIKKKSNKSEWRKS